MLKSRLFHIWAKDFWATIPLDRDIWAKDAGAEKNFFHISGQIVKKNGLKKSFGPDIYLCPKYETADKS